MLNVNDYDILRNHQCSLQETSKDTSKAKVQYMTTCTKKVVDFDAVKTEFLNSLNETEECAKSVDAFVIDDYNYFIEFKNGDARKENCWLGSKNNGGRTYGKNKKNYHVG